MKVNFLLGLLSLISVFAQAQTADLYKQRGLSPDKPEAVSAVSATAVSQNQLIFYDDFSRANTAAGTLGNATSDGLPYQMTGGGMPTAQVSGNAYISPSTAQPTYASKYFAGKTISRVTVSFKFTQTPSTSGGLALITSSDSASIALNNMNHWDFTGSGTTLATIWQGGVQNSLPAFATQPKTQTYVVGKIYTISLTIYGNSVHARLPDSSTVDVSDSRLAAVAGRRVIWEAFAGVAITRHEVYQSTSVPQYGHQAFPAGIEAPIGFRSPYSGIFRKIGIGSTLPGVEQLYVRNDNTTNDLALFDAYSGPATIRLKASTAGFQAGYWLSQNAGASFDVGMYTSVADLRFRVANTDALSIPFSGNLVSARGFTVPSITLNGTDLAATLAGKQNTLTLTTTGTGPATLSGNTLNIPTPVGGSSTTSGAALARRNYGLVIPVFRTTAKFDNLGGTQSATQLAIHASGGLISSSSGTAADGYIRLAGEIEGRKPSRTDFLLNWSPSETGASVSVGVGPASSGYLVTIANSGGNVVVTFPSGTQVTGALSGAQVMNVSFATANGGITASVHVLGTPASLAAGNPFRVPIWEWSFCTKNKLGSAYFKSNAVTCRIVGFLHNNKSWDGDPAGVLLTRTMSLHSCGWAGWGGEKRDHDSFIIIPERATPTSLLKVAHFFHQNGGYMTDILSVGQADNGETARQLLANGYALISSNGGPSGYDRESSGWGAPQAVAKSDEVYQTLTQHTANIGKEYLVGWSMGGGWSANYLRTVGTRVGAVWMSCPALDFEETGTGSIQANSQLKTAIDLAYAPWYISRVNSNSSDPRTDDGTSWARISETGTYPALGARSATIALTSSAVGNDKSVDLTLKTVGVRPQPGDILHFKYSGIARAITMTYADNSTYRLDGPVTVASGEEVSVIRGDGKFGYEYTWQNRPSTEWSASTQGAGNYAFRTSANTLSDVRPHNPSRYFDVYSELNVPITIMVGGTGSTSNDGILNNSQMFAFRDGVNGVAGGNNSLVTIIQGSGGHLVSTTHSATQNTSFFNAN